MESDSKACQKEWVICDELVYVWICDISDILIALGHGLGFTLTRFALFHSWLNFALAQTLTTISLHNLS